ncbi:MAG: glycosyltransferase [Roseobacter sp.]
MEKDRKTAHLSITVASLTLKRPKMVEVLLNSLGSMDVPENCTVCCLIVENDTAPVTQSLVEEMDPLPNRLALHYVLETEPGIPFARNRAAKEAIARGDDLLAFIDDDEIVAKDWLVQMVDGYRAGEAILLGGPRRIAPPLDGLSILENVMHNNITANFRAMEDRAAATSTFNQTPEVQVYTNNWLAETRLFSELGIWFDEAMRFTGGTDSKLCTVAKEKGLSVGWVSGAYVYETLTRDRLSFVYQHGRARDQINNLFHRRLKKQPLLRISLLLRLPIKGIEIVVLAISVPLTRGKTLLRLAKTTGWVSGRVGAALGIRSKLYSKITGD